MDLMCTPYGAWRKQVNQYISALLLCTFAVTAQAETFSTPILAVLDGDTVLVKRGTGTLSIRLAEIDAPEKAQPFGETSKKSLSELVMGKSVQVVSQTMDQYGRMIAHLNVNGLDINAEQVRRGMAWEYSNYHSNKVLIALQKEAQSVPRGLWALSKPIPPWVWRKTHPYLEAVSAPITITPLGENCGHKKYCNQMISCDEAKFYMTQCGIQRLDGNGDGVPCENLCAGRP